jgi:mRNA interferase MazF
MEKDFNLWNKKKQQIDARSQHPYFYAGEIWWVHLGQNIGYEMNGKSREYLRPVLILKKYNHNSFLAIPLSTSLKENKYRMPIGIVAGKNASVNLSQLRYLDSRRLAKKIRQLDPILLNKVKKKASEVNFD